MSAPGKTWAIYQLKDARTDAVRYVGMTTDAAMREAKHRLEWLSPGTHSSGDARLRWLSELRAAGAGFAFEVIGFCGSRTAARAAETKAIKRALANGHPLVNIQVAASAKRKAERKKPKRETPAQRIKRLEGALLDAARSLESIGAWKPYEGGEPRKAIAAFADERARAAREVLHAS